MLTTIRLISILKAILSARITTKIKINLTDILTASRPTDINADTLTATRTARLSSSKRKL